MSSLTATSSQNGLKFPNMNSGILFAASCRRFFSIELYLSI